MSQTIDQVFSDYNVQGVPASGEKKPSKAEIRALLKMIQNSGGQAVTRNTLSALNGVTPPNENYMGIVLTGPEAGYYSRSGGAWVFGRPFPDTVAGVMLSGNGTAQTGTLNPGVNPASVLFYFAEVDTPNTGPLKLTIGGVQRDVLNADGNPLSPGEWVGGVQFRINPEGKFQLINEAGAAVAAAASATEARDEADRAEGEADRSRDEADRAAGYAAGVVTGNPRDFITVAALLIDTALTYSGSTALSVAPGDIITARGFRYEVAASDAVDAHVETAGGVKLYVLPLGDRMYAAAFGIVGGTSDQNALLTKLFSAGAGYEIRLGRAQSYVSIGGLSLPDNTTLNFRGSVLNFNSSNDRHRCLEIYGSNVRVSGGTVKNVSGVLGYEGSMQTPITIGRFQELIGFRNVVVEDMTIETNSAGGNGIGVFGRSENVTIDRIYFPSSAYIGIPVIAHWSFNAAEVNLGGDRITAHQKNIRINNIKCGVLSRLVSVENPSALFGISVVFLSAVYSADVSNIICENFSRGKAVTVYAGDWGFQYSVDAQEEILGSKSISVRNVWGRYFSGVEVYMANTMGEYVGKWPAQVSFDGINVTGYGTVATASRGFTTAGADGVSIRNSSFDGFYNGGYPSTGTTRLVLEDNEFRNSRQYGINVTTNVVDAADWVISRNHFIDNNAAAASNMADIYINKVSGAKIEDNIFDSPLCANNVRTQGGANRPTRLKIRDNHTVRNPTSPLYILGTGSDTDIAEVFDGNTYETAPSVFKSGQLVIGAATSVSSAPLFIGQQAIIPGGAAYIATGITSAADWKQIT